MNTFLYDRFEVLQRLGEGSYSVVYKCNDVSTKHYSSKPIALKVVKHLDTVTHFASSDYEDFQSPRKHAPKSDVQLSCHEKPIDAREPSVAAAQDTNVQGAVGTGTQWTTWQQLARLQNTLSSAGEADTSTSRALSSEEAIACSNENAIVTQDPKSAFSINELSSMFEGSCKVDMLCPFLPRSAMREIMILSTIVPHPYIISLREVILPSPVPANSAKIAEHNKPSEPDAAARTEPHCDAAATLHKLASSPSLCLVFENVANGDLRQFMTSNPKFFTPKMVKILFYQLLLAVAHLHRSGVLHRDIKPHNILIDAQQKRIKLTDFNLATFTSSANLFWTDNIRSPLTNAVVTMWYRSPEVLLGSTVYDHGIDTWALGCVLWEMAHPMEGPLFRGNNEVEQIMRIFQLLGTPGHSKSSTPGEVTKNERRPGSFFQKDHRSISKCQKYTNRSAAQKSRRGVFPLANIGSYLYLSAPPIQSMPFFSKNFPQWSSTRNDALHAPALSPAGADLLFKLLEVEPTRRITAMAALSHPWFWED